MKRYIYLLLVCNCLFFISQAQAPLKEEDNQFSLSTGYTTTGIPVYLSFELPVHEDITFGIEGSIRFFNEKTDTVNYNHQLFGLGFFGNYYFNSLLNLDEKMGLYAGLHICYYKQFSPDEYMLESNSSSTLAAGAHLGYRYYFKSFAVFIEATGDTQYAGGKLGISYKFQ